MMRRLVLVLGLVTVASITVGAAAMLPITSSAPLQVSEIDTPPILPTEPPMANETVPDEVAALDETEGLDEPVEPAEPVWVCVMLVDHHGNVTSKPAPNPMAVPPDSKNAHDASDPNHPTYFAAEADPCPEP